MVVAVGGGRQAADVSDQTSSCPLSPNPSPARGEGEERRRWHLALLLRWVDENPPGVGNGWEPYPTSLRIVNWIKWALAQGSRALSPECQHSLAIQARWLRRRLEYHLLGNHLFANAKALVFAGAFFVGLEGVAGAVAREPASWLALGQRLLRRELAEQIVPDGGHFERSPMYHALLLEDVLDLINLAGAYPGLFAVAGTGAEVMDGTVAAARVDAVTGTVAVAHWRATATAMLRWLAAMTHPDVALIGPDYLPGHAHADTLSFELSLFGQRVIVNGGTSRYGSGPERLAERGTAAHSTVPKRSQLPNEPISNLNRVIRADRARAPTPSPTGGRLSVGAGRNRQTGPARDRPRRVCAQRRVERCRSPAAQRCPHSRQPVQPAPG